MVLRKNKKGFAFYFLMFVISIVIFALAKISYEFNNEDTANDFGETFIEIDRLYSKNPAFQFYFSESVETGFANSKRRFSQNLGFSVDEMIERKGGCEYSGKKLWFNEEIESLEKTCLPSFNRSNIDEVLGSYINEDMNKVFEDGYSAIGVDSPDISIGFDEESSSFNLNVDGEVLKSKGMGKTFLNLDVNHQADVNLYLDLMLTMKSVLPVLSDKLKKSVPKCIEDNSEKSIENIEFYCIEKGTKSLILEKSSTDIFETYEIGMKSFELEDEEKKKQFYGLTFIIIDKKTGEEELSINAIIKDTIPYNLVNFRVENYENRNNMVKLTIEEPKFSENIFSYVVLYSYEDFFDEVNYGAYSRLMNMLENSKIPSEFEDSSFDMHEGRFYYSKKENNMDLSLLAVSSSGFTEDGNIKKKEIPLYQIHDFSSQTNEDSKFKTSLLEEGKELYVFVFAVDFNHNYYVDTVTGKTKKVSIQKYIVPRVLAESEVELKTDIENMQDSFSLKIEGYDDQDFDHYDIYIKDSDESSYENCKNDMCIIIDGKGKLGKANANYLISFDKTATPLQGYDFIQINSDFLKSDIKYDFKIVPKDANDGGINDRTSYKSPEKNNLDFYSLSNSKDDVKPFEVKGMQILDNKAPHPMSSISLMSPSITVDDKVWLNWNAIDEDVNTVRISGVINHQNGKSTFNDLAVDLESKQIPTNIFPAQINSIEITKIIPVDKYGNKDIETTQTHTASWSRN